MMKTFALVPKKDNPSKIGDFKPIFLELQY
jgi:hypothetical protein